LKDLYNQFGDWYLAMAAYNSGPGTVQAAVRRTGYADFWELYRRNALPAETKNYVPIILAAIIMAKNPKQYGLDTMVADPPVLFDTVTINYSVDLRLVADVTDAPVQEITALNPSLLRMTTPADEPFDLHLPAGTGNLFQQRVSEIPEDKRRFWRFHKVTAGETLEDVARSYHMRAADIAFVNQLSENASLNDTESLVIPVAPASAGTISAASQYRAQKGDTLVKVADRFGVTVDQLRRWNHLKGSAITPGRHLFVAEPAHITRSTRSSRRSSGRRSASTRSSRGRSSGRKAASSSRSNHSSAKKSKHR
jgi:membrane-bound lytic murein transglycosylase D